MIHTSDFPYHTTSSVIAISLSMTEVYTVSETLSMLTTTPWPMPCFDDITDSMDYTTVSTLISAGAFVVLICLCCLLVVLPVCICVRKRRIKEREDGGGDRALQDACSQDLLGRHHT